MEYPIDLPGGAQLSTKSICDALVDHPEAGYEPLVICPELLTTSESDYSFKIRTYKMGEKRAVNLFYRIEAFKRIISEEKPAVRSVDIAKQKGFSKPSISVAVKNMKAKGYVTVSGEGYITLTESGKALAERVYERHKFFRKWLISLGVNEETANDDACRIEHVITKETFEAIKRSVEK